MSDTEVSQQSPEEEELWGSYYSAAGCRGRYTAGEHILGSGGDFAISHLPLRVTSSKRQLLLDVVSKP